MRPALIAALLIITTACGDNFAAVQAEDSIEAYENYLKNNPDGRFAMEANARLEDLYLQAARDGKSLEGYDRYLERFPDGALREKGLKEREEFLFAWANETNTGETWKKFLEEYPRAEKTRRAKAKRMINVHTYSENLEVSPPRVEQINLAEDPEGPLNGWGFWVDVTNNGSKTIESLSLTIEYLNGEGGRLGQREWPVVAPYWPVPVEEERKVPMKPGETREWEWSTGNLPEGWGRRVRVYPSRISMLEKGKKK